MPLFCIDVGDAGLFAAPGILIRGAVTPPVQVRRLDLSGVVFFFSPFFPS